MGLERWSDEKGGKLIVNTMFAVGMRHESSSKLAMQALTIPLAAGRYAIVRMNSKKSADSNWGPRSDLSDYGGHIVQSVFAGR